MDFKKGMRVMDNYYREEDDPIRLGTIIKLNVKQNNRKEYVHLIRWDDGEEKTYHPKFLLPWSKLHEALK